LGAYCYPDPTSTAKKNLIIEDSSKSVRHGVRFQLQKKEETEAKMVLPDAGVLAEYGRLRTQCERGEGVGYSLENPVDLIREAGSVPAGEKAELVPTTVETVEPDVL
jgi:hypothetical protein